MQVHCTLYILCYHLWWIKIAILYTHIVHTSRMWFWYTIDRTTVHRGLAYSVFTRRLTAEQWASNRLAGVRGLTFNLSTTWISLSLVIKTKNCQYNSCNVSNSLNRNLAPLPCLRSQTKILGTFLSVSSWAVDCRSICRQTRVFSSLIVRQMTTAVSRACSLPAPPRRRRHCPPDCMPFKRSGDSVGTAGFNVGMQRHGHRRKNVLECSLILHIIHAVIYLRW